MNWDVFGRFDSKPNSISTNFQNGDLDVVSQNDFLVFLTANNQHSSDTPSVKYSQIKGEIPGWEKYTHFLTLASSKIYTLLAH